MVLYLPPLATVAPEIPCKNNINESHVMLFVVEKSVSPSDCTTADGTALATTGNSSTREIRSRMDTIF